jgi:hypothetical protein
MKKIQNNIGVITSSAVVAGGIGWLAHAGWTMPAAALALFASSRSEIQAKGWNWRVLADTSVIWLSGVSVAVLVALMPGRLGLIVGRGHFTPADGIVLAYAVWLVLLSGRWLKGHKNIVAGAVNQFVSTAAIFLAAAYWHWSSLLVVALVWLASFLIANSVLIGQPERIRMVLSLTWALIAAETAWILSVWLVYHLQVWLGGLIIPQAAIVLTVLGYCFGGIYTSHKAAKLNRGRLIEYLAIGLTLLITVIAGTEWNKII